ncbi:MAG: signal recognition particle subunit SRP19/SEC65 family protein [Candidatus Bathyarchaeota archaeon]|nr:signal recognition particle subunit SRP19/SEC65 family protein [Candidatus Bathyarchaeota archaeon]
MRKQDNIIIWPTYFDLTKTRKDGRRVPKSLAVPTPTILEVQNAVQKLGLKYALRPDAGYARTPWLKAGMLLVAKTESKEKTISKIAKQLLKNRSAMQAQQEKKH